MKTLELTPELLADLEEVRNSMSIEGFDMTDDQFEEVAGDYLKDDTKTKLEELKAKAEREGLDFDDLVIEAFKFSKPFSS